MKITPMYGLFMLNASAVSPRFSAKIKIIPANRFYNLDCSKNHAGYIKDYPLELPSKERFFLDDRWADREQAYSCNAYNCTMWGLYHQNGVILRHFNSLRLNGTKEFTAEVVLWKLKARIRQDVNEMRNFFWPVKAFIIGGQVPSEAEPDREKAIRSLELKTLITGLLSDMKVPFSTMWGAKENSYRVHANAFFDVDSQTWQVMFAEHDRGPMKSGRLLRSLKTLEEVREHLTQFDLLPDDELYVGDEPVSRALISAPAGESHQYCLPVPEPATIVQKV